MKALALSDLGDESRPPVRNVFFALQPDAGSASRIEHLSADLVREHRLRGRPINKERLHITLSFLGAFPQGTTEEVLSGLESMASAVRQAQFEVVLDELVTFPGRPRPWVLLAKAAATHLEDLHRSLRRGLPVDRFVPHLTLLRDRRMIEPRPIEPITWTAVEFVLLASHAGESRYTTLGRWPLSA